MIETQPIRRTRGRHGRLTTVPVSVRRTALLAAAEQGREDPAIIGMTHMLRHDAEHGVMTMFEMLVDAFTSLLWDERECLLDAWKSKCIALRAAAYS